MTDETAQPSGAAESLSVREAVAAMLPPEQPERPRDERGRFAGSEQDQPEDAPDEALDEIDAAEGDDPEAAQDDAEGDAPEAADEAQPEDDIPLPVSWSEEDAATWKALPAQAKAKILAREAQRDAAVNAKFQEAANVRKAAEAEAQQAAQHRAQLLQQIDLVQSLVVPERPDPAMLNPQSDRYDPEGYLRAQAEHDAAREYLGGLQQQKQQLLAQQQAQERAAWEQREAAERPKLLAAVPDLANPEKAPAILAQLHSYGIEAGFTPEMLAEATSGEVTLLWKAMQYDKQKAAAQQVKAQARPQQKPAAPAVKPGVSVPQSSRRVAEVQQLNERLSKTGSIEDAVRLSLALASRK